MTHGDDEQPVEMSVVFVRIIFFFHFCVFASKIDETKMQS